MKVISDITVDLYEMINTNIITINFLNAMNCAFMFIISNNYG